MGVQGIDDYDRELIGVDKAKSLVFAWLKTLSFSGAAGAGVFVSLTRTLYAPSGQHRPKRLLDESVPIRAGDEALNALTDTLVSRATEEAARELLPPDDETFEVFQFCVSVTDDQSKSARFVLQAAFYEPDFDEDVSAAVLWRDFARAALAGPAPHDLLHEAEIIAERAARIADAMMEQYRERWEGDGAPESGDR